MTRVPITSPLAVLTTRTTQEHLMATHSTTDLKPGDIVQHPEHGYGVVLKNFPGVPTIYFAGKHGYENTTRGFTGWERVETETARPGHVQVRVDDLGEDGEYLSDWLNADEDSWGLSGRLAIRVANALAAQRAESAPPADEPEIVGDGCECWVTPEHMWTTHYGAVEPGSQVENNPRCPKHGEKPMSATVTLYCPDCGEAITDTAMVVVNREGDRYLGFCTDAAGAHTCPPAQPEEPTEFGAKVTVDGVRWMRVNGYPYPWHNENRGAIDWDDLVKRGTVTIGWDE